MKTITQLCMLVAATTAFYILTSAILAQGRSAKEPSPVMPQSEKPRFTSEGKLIAPAAHVYREWLFVGTPITPNDLNEGQAAFPEFHNVYINPSAWREWKKSGTYPDGTVMVKELASVGS